MTDPSQAAKQFISSKQGEWAALVTVAWVTKPNLADRAAKVLAEAANVGSKTLKRKIAAIHHAREQGLSLEEITSRGQKKILEQFVKEKVKARTLPLVAFPHKLTPPVRDAFDASCRRVANLLGLKTWDEVIDWINAQIELATDEEILHGGGECGTSKNTGSSGAKSSPPAAPGKPTGKPTTPSMPA
jgi:hypothetical protein